MLSSLFAGLYVVSDAKRILNTDAIACTSYPFTCKSRTGKMIAKSLTDIKQLLDEVEHDIMNYQNRGLCYLPKPKAEADNTDTRF